MYFGGVEGGATHSNLVICDEKGHVVSRAKGLGTNHWALGIDECAKRILLMLHSAKQDAGIALDTPLDALGLTLSGCEQESSNAELAARVMEMDAASAREIYVASDTAGSLATAAPDGGMVLIAGTGSNGFLKAPTGEEFGCGGWGHLLGDEGGAFWIAHKAVKAVFDDVDNLRPSPHPTHNVWEKVKEHFGAQDRADILPHMYKHFDKSHFAGLTIKLSELAWQGDALAQHLFLQAGMALAMHAAVLSKRCNAKKLRVVCVGSVWKSWDQMRKGAEAEWAANQVTTVLELVRLRVSSALGAAWLAAKTVNYDLPRDDSAYCEIFYTFYPEDNKILTNGDHSLVNGVKQSNGIIGDQGCACNNANW